MEDQRLLREYVASHSEDAFTELVRIHLRLVYSAARRKVSDPAAAEDVTQAVFTLLAQKAGSLGPEVILAGWLYQTACFKAAQHQRAEHRRAKREHEAAAMHELDARSEPEAAWERIEPLLDEAMLEMSEADRAAILLRFFQGKRLREVGDALGLEEDAARRRVDRALEKLREWFGARGVAYPAASIAAALSAQAASATPALLAATVSAAALKAAAVTTATAASALPAFLAVMKLKHVLLTASILFLGAAAAVYHFSPSEAPPAPPRAERPMPAEPAVSGTSTVARLFQSLEESRQAQAAPDDELQQALARFREALYGPPKPADQKTDEARDLLAAMPVEKRAAALDMVLAALRNDSKHVCLRAVGLVPLIWPQGEAALPILFDLVRNKSREWPEVASMAMIAAAQARPKPDVVPELVAAAMQGPRDAHRALANSFPLLKSFIPGSEAAFATSLQPYLFSPDPAWRSTAAQTLAQLPGPKHPAILRELTAALAAPADGAPLELAHFGPSLQAMMKMGPDAAKALPALQEFAARNPQWTDHVNLAIKSIAPAELSGVGVFTPLPPLDAKAAAVADEIETGAVSIPQLAAQLDDPKTALAAARALAEFGPAAKEALPHLQRALDAAVESDHPSAIVLGAAIERLDPESPKPLLSSIELVPALQAVQAEAQRANVPAWNSALQTLPERVPLRSAFTHETMRLLAADLGNINPRLREAFIGRLRQSDEKFAKIFEPSR